MFRKLSAALFAAMLALTGGLCAFADPFEPLTPVIPDAPIETDAEQVTIVASYDPESDLSTYVLTLKDAAAFADGTPVTAQDVLFTYYYYLDPDYSGGVDLASLGIPGVEPYRLQCSAERIESLSETMSAIEAAGADHAWSEADGWSEALQETYWALRAEYRAVADEQFPALAQIMADFYSASIPASGALGYTAEEIAASDDLRVAYAMVTWGYASYSDGELVTTYSKRVWNVADGFVPTIDDFAAELSLAYDGDLAACWSAECPDASLEMPELPDVRTEFLRAAIGDEHDAVASISGIRMIDDRTVEVDLAGVNVSSGGALFGVEILSLAACGDAAQWDPDAGLYGHPFGDVSAVQTEGGAQIYAASSAFGAAVDGE